MSKIWIWIAKGFKINIELNVVGDGRRFLNFWNHLNGDDVVAEFKDGELWIDRDGKKYRMDLGQFINQATKSFVDAYNDYKK